MSITDSAMMPFLDQDAEAQQARVVPRRCGGGVVQLLVAADLSAWLLWTFRATHARASRAAA
jgi:hypothetical protein